MAVTTRRRRSVLATSIIVLIVILEVAVLLVGRAWGLGNVVLSSSFQDPLGLYSVTVPHGWKAVRENPGQVTQGNGSVPPTSITVEKYQFQDEQKGDTSAYVAVFVESMDSAAAHALLCHPVQYPTTTVAGEPASVGPGSEDSSSGSIYEFYSGNAFFQVHVDVPLRPVTGAGGAGYGPVVLPTPTVVDGTAVYVEAQSLLSSIKVTDPGSC
jgi:hypothetical protein